MSYMVVSAYSQRELIELPYSEALRLIGLYDGVSFHQPVPCRYCGEPMYVEFNAYGEPETAQCLSCNRYMIVYYTNTKNFCLPWRKAE